MGLDLAAGIMTVAPVKKKGDRLGLKKVSRRKVHTIQRKAHNIKRPHDVFRHHDSERFASYHGVHKKRVEYLTASVKCLESQPVSVERDANIALIMGWLAVSSEYVSLPNYKVMGADRSKVAGEFMLGLYRFVNHSDCDGTWHREDCAFIGAWLTAIRPFLKTELLAKDPKEHKFEMGWEDRYTELFVWAGNQDHGCVICC